MRFQERFPGGAFLPLRRGFYAVPFQYIFDRVWCNDVADISQCALYSVVTPGGILPRHAEHQIGDLLRDAGSTRSLPGIGPLLRDELTVRRLDKLPRASVLQTSSLVVLRFLDDDVYQFSESNIEVTICRCSWGICYPVFFSGGTFRCESMACQRSQSRCRFNQNSGPVLSASPNANAESALT